LRENWSEKNKIPEIHRSSFHAISIMFCNDRFPFNNDFLLITTIFAQTDSRI
jgi:hypothetical protein